MPPTYIVHTERVGLGPIRHDLLPLYQRWINDLAVNRFLESWPFSEIGEVGWYERISRSERTAYFTIYDVETARPIGGVDLHDLDRAHRTGEVGIMIGESDFRGRGYGTEAVRLVCDYGFHALGLHAIMIRTFGWNIAAQKAYTRAGFREVGRLRQARWFDGRPWDVILYDLLRDEFESPIVRAIMTDGLPIDD